MRAKKVGTCRGDGKIYIRLSIADQSAEGRYAICAHAANGQKIPCNLYRSLTTDDRTNRPYYVAAFPDLDIKAESFTVSDALNSSNSCTLPLSFEKAKWESRLNYRVNPRLCKEIRGFDKISTYANMNFEYWECIEDSDNCILRGVVRLPYREDSQPEVSCYDLNLHEIVTTPVVLGNRQIISDIADDVTLREIQVSIRLPKPISSSLFILRDKMHPEFDSFNTLPADMFQKLVSDTNEVMMNAQVDPEYPSWLNKHKASLDVLSKEAGTFFAYRPRYSIIVPLFNTPQAYFSDMLQSVMQQSYGKWELVLVNASPENIALSHLAQQAAESDARVKLITLSENNGISENTNAGISIARGDFICFFDHDDIIEPDILFEYTKALNSHSEVDVLYCDEDKLMPNGEYAQPFFKPDFNLDLLRNNNYICHMLTIRKTLLDTLPRNTREFDGAQDHNLTLCAIEKARKVHHVARILYHWRLSETSTAANADSKPYATLAGIKAVQSHLNRLGIHAKVTQSRRPFTYRVQYDIPRPSPLISIIIPTKDHVDVLDTCINSIMSKSTYSNYEIILVENNSTEAETFEYYHRIIKDSGQRIRTVTWPGEFNFSKLINYGVKHASGNYLLFLNNDTEVITPTWLEELLGNCARKDVGAVGCRLFYRDDTIQHAGVCVTGGVAGHLGKNLPKGQWGYFALADAAQNLSAVTAACMLTKRSVFDSVGGFTEELSVAFNDIDYCLKVREQGKLVVYTPEAELYHYESLSRGYETSTEKKIRFHREISYMNYRWAEYYVNGDPYININITSNEPYNYYYHL